MLAVAARMSASGCRERGNRGEAIVQWRGETVGPAWRDFEVVDGELTFLDEN